MLAGISIALPNGRGSDGKSRRSNEAIRATTVRRCERIARARARQAEPPAPPRQTLAFSRWRRRFRLRIDIFSRLLTVAARLEAIGASSIRIDLFLISRFM